MIPKKPIVILCRDCWKSRELCRCANPQIPSWLTESISSLNPILDAVVQQQEKDAWYILLTEQDRLFLRQIHISAE